MKPVLYFLAGLAVGSAATYFAVKDYFEAQAEQRIQKEVDSVKESYLKRAAAKDLADKNTEEKRRRVEVRRQKARDISDNELSPDPNDPEERKTIREIQQIRRRYNREAFAEEDEPVRRHNVFDDQDDFYEEHPSEGAEERPYPITPEEFANEKRFFDKITIYLYRDDVAVDEQERVVDDLEQLVGIENIGRLGDLCDDENVVLIRNEMRSADYEIRLMEEDYIPDAGIPVRDE